MGSHFRGMNANLGNARKAGLAREHYAKIWSDNAPKFRKGLVKLARMPKCFSK